MYIFVFFENFARLLDRKGEHLATLEEIRRQGFARVRVDEIGRAHV